MSSPTDGFEALQWSPVLTRDVLGVGPSPLMIGQNMLWVDQDVHYNVFLPKAHCTSLPSAMLLAL